MRFPWHRTKLKTASIAAFQAHLPDLLPEPTPLEQQRALDAMRSALSPLAAAERLPGTFLLQPGLRLRKSFGNCRFRPGEPPVITVRCTGDDGVWRPRSAIMLTLLHELVHLKCRGHDPRFWSLLRRLVALATERGLYHPDDDDASEPTQGNGKLAGSPAAARASAAAEVKRQRSALARQAARGWVTGDLAVVDTPRGPLAGRTVTVVKVGRTRILAALSDGHRYSIPAGLLRAAGPA
ncbi:MAG: DUF45 domain-containing protein [Dehalococcoidia bacterium]|nr:DUF45 domain-containing protein [Dehalococcoidia bacterium]